MNYYYIFKIDHGWIGLAGHDGRLTRSTLPQSTREEAMSCIEAGLNADSIENPNAFDNLPDKFARYFSGEKVDFSDVDVDLGHPGAFLEAAQRAAMTIPYGTLVTYKELARMAGRERAARAAGTAMAKNPLSIVVPCHRVIAAGGAIGGFGPGLEWKRELLKLEGVDI